MYKTAAQIADDVLLQAQKDYRDRQIMGAAPTLIGMASIPFGMSMHSGHRVRNALLGAGLGVGAGIGLAKLLQLLPKNQDRLLKHPIDTWAGTTDEDIVARAKNPMTGYLAGAAGAVPAGIAALFHNPDQSKFLPLVGRQLAQMGLFGAGLTGSDYVANKLSNR